MDSEMDTPSNFIKIPLYGMYYLTDLEDFSGFDENEWTKFRAPYSGDEFEEISDAIRWAVRNPDFDFASLLPGLPHDNATIYQYFSKLAASLDNPEKRLS